MAATSARPIDMSRCGRWAGGTLLAYVVVCAVLLLTAGRGDPAWFVHFGKKSSAIHLAYEVLGQKVRVPHVDGHDGQAYWVVARDPLLLHPRSTGAALDRPAYRAQRILYSALAAPFRLFGERGLLWGLLVVNLLAAGLGAALTSALAQDVGAPPRAALGFTLAPPILVAVVFDMSDVIAITAVVATVLLLRRRRFGWAVACGVAAALAKEPSLFALGGLAVLAPGMRLRRRAALVGLPAGFVAAWAVYLRWRLMWPPSKIQEFTPVPLYGYFDAWRRGWHPVGNYADALVAVVVLAVAVAIVAVWWQHRSSMLMIAALPYGLLVPFLSAQVLDLSDNSWRALGPAITFLVITVYAFSARGQPAGADTTTVAATERQTSAT